MVSADLDALAAHLRQWGAQGGIDLHPAACFALADNLTVAAQDARQLEAAQVPPGYRLPAALPENVHVLHAARAKGPLKAPPPPAPQPPSEEALARALSGALEPMLAAADATVELGAPWLRLQLLGLVEQLAGLVLMEEPSGGEHYEAAEAAERWVHQLTGRDAGGETAA